jgi:ABC-type glycerol-3-phosphate transport system substrate-binding protein
MRKRRSTPVVVLALALLAAACSSGNGGGGGTGATSPPAAASQTLKGVCPDPVVVQTSWFPETELATPYQLVGSTRSTRRTSGSPVRW